MMGRGLIGCFIDALCDWVSLCFFFPVCERKEVIFFGGGVFGVFF